MSIPIYNAKQIKEWDEFTIKNEPIASIDLMERAAHQCVDKILNENTNLKSVNVFAGVGNNGGDGLVIARALHFCNIKVHLYIVEFSKTYSEDFSKNLEMLGGNVMPTYINEKHRLSEVPFADLNIDAIFGSGLSREIEDGWLGDLIQLINESQLKTVAIDFPSGLFSFDNRNNGLINVIKANETLTFQLPKLPFFFSRYESFVGDYKVIEIGLHPFFSAETKYELVDIDDVVLKTVSKFAHKGTRGHLLIVGGFDKMYGAVTLATKSAYKTGCGFVFVKMQTGGVPVLLNHILEAVTIDNLDKIKNKLKAIAIGVGLGQSENSLTLLKQVLAYNLPTVIDADALNLLAKHKGLLEFISNKSILTPHVKELIRLVGQTDSEEELLEKQIEFSKKHKVYMIQKGAYSKLTCPDGRVLINSTGNSSMAVAGMGDVLTGIIGSLLAQGYSVEESAKYGMLIHGRAGDLMRFENGWFGNLPTDLLNFIPKVMNSENIRN
jgi:NAD(P)H-hydrate epimerase